MKHDRGLSGIPKPHGTVPRVLLFEASSAFMAQICRWPAVALAVCNLPLTKKFYAASHVTFGGIPGEGGGTFP